MQDRRVRRRLAGDQGAEVFLARGPGAMQFDNKYFYRGKTILPPCSLIDTSSADVVIVDGDRPVKRLPHQVVMRVYAALPGDEAYGDLPVDCSEDLLNALVGFYTDMSITGPILGRPVIDTPLPLCSIYAGVNGAIGISAALVDRTRTGLGRKVQASRLAGGLSAIGALTVGLDGQRLDYPPRRRAMHERRHWHATFGVQSLSNRGHALPENPGRTERRGHSPKRRRKAF